MGWIKDRDTLPTSGHSPMNLNPAVVPVLVQVEARCAHHGDISPQGDCMSERHAGGGINRGQDRFDSPFTLRSRVDPGFSTRLAIHGIAGCAHQQLVAIEDHCGSEFITDLGQR